MDITSRGDGLPLVTYTAKDKSVGECEILSFRAEDPAPGSAASTRAGGGTATVAITRPDGRKRFIFFERGKAIGADLSQADGSQHFKATRKDDRYLIEAGHERYELVKVLVYGG